MKTLKEEIPHVCINTYKEFICEPKKILNTKIKSVTEPECLKVSNVISFRVRNSTL